MVELPVTFVADLVTNANEQIANFSDVILLVMGLGLALIAIGSLLSFLRK